MTKRSEIVTNDGRLYHLGVAADEVARSVFLVGDPARAYTVAERFDSVDHEVKNREFVTLTGSYQGVAMSVVGTGIGTDNLEIALIELDAAHGFDLDTAVRFPEVSPLHIIRIGTSGGIQPDIAAGTLCVAEYALGLDSTGPYYEVPPADALVVEIEKQARRLLDEDSGDARRFGGRLPVYASKADPLLTDLLVSHAAANGWLHASGITVSSPGFYGPSSRFVDGLVNTVPDIKGTLARVMVDGRRVVNMEMESSLLFHLAAALGHRAGTICPAISQPGAPAALVDYGAAVASAITVALGAMVELNASAGR